MKYILLILIGILTSCSLSTFEQQREQINTIIIHYDILLNSIENTDVSSAGSNLKRYKQALAYSKTKLSIDKKPSLKTMTYLNDLKLMKRQFKNAPNRKKSFKSNIKKNQEQLKNLLNDIDNDIFTNEQLNAILVREEQALNGISIQISEFQSAYTNYEVRFDSLYQLSQTFNYQ
tara:strand:- start:446 stop:970 length:525 start_codon:yes stop_codon:yes gene_type:complete